MIELKVQTEWNAKRLLAAVDRASERNHRQTAFDIMRTAQASIDTSDEPSPPGQPPHTRGRGRKNLRSAVRYDATKTDAVVGPMQSVVGEIGAVHEFGETFRGTDYDERAFMGPALDEHIDRFALMWAGSIGE